MSRHTEGFEANQPLSVRLARPIVIPRITLMEYRLEVDLWVVFSIIIIGGGGIVDELGFSVFTTHSINYIVHHSSTT